MVERRSPKPNVEGSSPSWPVILKKEVFMAKIGTFWKECIGELRKVVWPTASEVGSSVKVVLISTLIVAVFLGGLDAFFIACVGWIF